MCDGNVEFEKEEILDTLEAPDEALEIFADQQNGYYTLGACTGLSACPA
jgi:hypothetical protein